MLHPLSGQSADWMLICPLQFTKWFRSGTVQYLSEYHALSFGQMLSMHLDDIMEACPEGDLLHELTHSMVIFNLFGENLALGNINPERMYSIMANFELEFFQMMLNSSPE